MEWLRKVLLLLSVIGVFVSGAGLVATFLGAEKVEAASNELVISEIEQQIRKIVTPEPVHEEGKLAALRNKMADNAEKLADKILGGDFPARLRQRVGESCVCKLSLSERAAALRDYEEARVAVAVMIEAVMSGKLSAARLEKGTIPKLVGGYHVATVDGLIRELRIFLGSNLVLFAVIGLAAFFAFALIELLVPAGILMLGAIATGCFYIFGQNWLATILLHHWTGFAYLAWVGLVSLFLADVLLNRARVTGHIVSSISPSNVSPC